jgi:hypothetical protein
MRAPNDEEEVQRAIAAVLTEQRYEFEREVRLAATDRIDFLIESGIGVEVKIQGSALAATRQLLRYAEHPRVRELILFTTRSQIVVPSELGGKPVVTVRRFPGL